MPARRRNGRLVTSGTASVGIDGGGWRADLRRRDLTPSFLRHGQADGLHRIAERGRDARPV
jgi:hypothetical protein